MRSALNDRGAVTAEFAVALPAILVVLALAVGALSAAAGAVRLQHAAAEASRLLGRGEDDATAFAPVVRAGGSARVDRGDGLVCVDASLAAPVPFPPVAVRSCALDGGR